MASSGDAEAQLHVEKVWARIRANSPIYSFLFSDIRIHSVATGVVRALLQLQPQHINSKGGLHGSVSAALVDWVGGLAICASDGLPENSGVSTDIHVSYVASASEGDWIEVEGKAVRVGASLAFTTATIHKVTETPLRYLVATASHTKYIRDTSHSSPK